MLLFLFLMDYVLDVTNILLAFIFANLYHTVYFYFSI